MQRAPSFLRNASQCILFLGLAATIWAVIQFTEPRSQWLTVEAPRQAIEGQNLTLRIHLAAQPEPGFLGVDLHWGTSLERPFQYLGSGGSRPVSKEAGVYDCKVMVPPRQGMRYVQGVIFWGREAGWNAHQLAANTRPFPVISTTAAAWNSTLVPLELQKPSHLAGEPRPAAGYPRWITGALFLLAAAAWQRKFLRSKKTPVAGWAKRLSQGFIVFLVVAGVWEGFNLEKRLGDRLRDVARSGEVYHPRATFQKIAVSAAAMGFLACVVVIARSGGNRRLLWTVAGTYASLALISLISLHPIDRIAGISWHGWTVMQTFKLLCAVLVLYGVLGARERPTTPDPGHAA